MLRAIFFLAVFLCAISPGRADPPLRLTCHLDKTVYWAGDELHPTAELRNESDEPLELHILKPWRLVPELLDEQGKLLDAPAVVIDQIVVPETLRLEPHGSISVGVIPVVLDPGSGPHRDRAGITRGHWQPRPGAYRVRISMQLSECLPGAKGGLTSNSAPLTVGTVLQGKLAFQSGQGYSVITNAGARVPLRLSENKILVGALQEKVGQTVALRGVMKAGALESIQLEP